MDKNENQFTKPVEIDVVELVTHIFLSSQGDLLFYNASVLKQFTIEGRPSTRNIYQSFWSERNGEEWLQPQPLEFPNAPYTCVYDIAQNGSIALIKAATSGLAIIQKTPQGWSDPELIGYIPTSYDQAQMTEDGKIIAVTAYQQPDGAQQTDARGFDLNLYGRDSEGKWNKQKVNEDNTTPLSSEFLLCKNGEKLFWVPQDISAKDSNGG